MKRVTDSLPCHVVSRVPRFAMSGSEFRGGNPAFGTGCCGSVKTVITERFSVVCDHFAGIGPEVHARRKDAGTDVAAFAQIRLAKQGGAAKHCA